MFVFTFCTSPPEFDQLAACDDSWLDRFIAWLRGLQYNSFCSNVN